MQTELRQARNVAIVVGVGLLLLIIGALIWGQSGTHDDQSVTIGNDTKLTLLSGSSLKTIDADFWRYTDERLGFAMDIPKSMWYYGATCSKEQDGTRYLDWAKAPVRIFQHENTIRIAPEYTYLLQDEHIQENHDNTFGYYFNDCIKVSLTSPQLEFHFIGWNIISRTVANEDELNAFLRQYYGDTCQVDELTPASQEGVYRVSIAGDGLSLDETKCQNYQALYTLYSPEYGRVISWSLGQEATYWSKNPDEQDGEITTEGNNYDQRMVDSVEILPAN
ncbi:MAG: hypothetical protein H6760_00250 [Candidatus Nomurabacteria bacterium]|nr:MAG: hypothetical protein H6760_00250 [Candidatus Nomurabacteria bacterium]